VGVDIVDCKNLLPFSTVELLWRVLYCGPVLEQGNAITLQKQLHAYFVCKKTPSLCSRWSESFVYQCVTGLISHLAQFFVLTGVAREGTAALCSIFVDHQAVYRCCQQSSFVSYER